MSMDLQNPMLIYINGYATYRRAISTRKSTQARLAWRSLKRDGETLLRNQSKIRSLGLQMAAGKILLRNKV